MARSLEKISYRMMNASSSLNKIKELVDLEIHPIAIRDLNDPDKVQNFLNTLGDATEDYPKFIVKHPVFFLMRISSFQAQLPLNQSDVHNSAKTLLSIIENFKNIKLFDNTDPADTLDNKNVASIVSQFANNLLNFDPLSSVFIQVPQVIGIFRCVEELVFSCYSLHWQTFPPINFPLLNYGNQNILELWCLTSHINNLNLTHNLPKLQSLKNLAKILITKEQDLFVPNSTPIETSLTLPLAKKKAIEIFKAFDENVPSTIAGPILAFRDSDLNSMTIDFMFMYDHIIEGICSNNIHSCSTKTVNSFVKKCIQFMISLIQFIQTTCSTKNSLSLQEIETIRTAFIKCGLSESACIAFRTIVVMTSPKPEIGWKKLKTFMHLIDNITMFADFFYKCLNNCSPTSISYRSITNIIKLSFIEQSSKLSWHSGNLSKDGYDWHVSQSLKIFLPKPEEKEILSLFKEIQSNFMKYIFSISLKRDWDFTKAQQLFKNILIEKSQETKNYTIATKKEVEKFCDSLEIGDTEYAQNIVQSQHFAPVFIRTKVFPIIQTIMSNSTQKHTILIKLKWLMLFAMEDATGLIQIRRPITLLYFQLMDLFDQNTSRVSVINILDYLEEIGKLIKDAVPDAPQIPTNFINNVYQIAYTPMAMDQISAVNYFLREIQPVLNATWSVMKISHTLCHTKYNYLSEEQIIEIPVHKHDNKLKVSIKIFKDTLKTLERSIHESLVLVTNACHELHNSYVSCLTILEATQTILNHPVKINRVEPNFFQIKETLLGCLKRYRELLSTITQSCAYSLTLHFNFLFETDLLPEKTIKSILEFSDDKDNPNVFMDSIQQPIESSQGEHIQDNTKNNPILSEEDISNIREIYDNFPSLDSFNDFSETTHSIKLSYSDKLNSKQIQLDWETFKDSVYVPKDTPDTLTHISIESIEQAITSNF
ncbi:tegument protein UL37 [Vespertilionid gammaherpesvirus 1]|uniref:Tegument protein UL37 n=1 Tax=Vespertilionid gammaherpesvirus 1 TaxID=2560830 RepID=A0A120HQI4_9GAMA|nr:tegument protein UL37 [Myotis gammaherpesvirus 8]AMA67420.1 tegument protein UL37 [Vespertilionid gammaherpesvirus 1]